MARAYYPATQALLLLQLAWQAESSLPEMLNDCTGQPVADAVNPCQLIGAGIANALQAAKGLEQRLASFGVNAQHLLQQRGLGALLAALSEPRIGKPMGLGTDKLTQ